MKTGRPWLAGVILTALTNCRIECISETDADANEAMLMRVL